MSGGHQLDDRLRPKPKARAIAPVTDDALPPNVRVLPMSDRVEGFVGLSIDAVQKDFFLNTLRRTGRFRYCRSGLRSPTGTAVLFQFKARIVATATLVGDERYAEKRDGFAGAMRFEPKSVRVFSPWDAAMLRTVWRGFGTFGHARFHLNPGNWPAFVAALRDVR